MARKPVSRTLVAGHYDNDRSLTFTLQMEDHLFTGLVPLARLRAAGYVKFVIPFFVGNKQWAKALGYRTRYIVLRDAGFIMAVAQLSSDDTITWFSPEYFVACETINGEVSIPPAVTSYADSGEAITFGSNVTFTVYWL